MPTRVSNTEVHRRGTSRWLSVTLWVLAFVLTTASAIYQRVTGPTHSMIGSVRIAGETLQYRLPRSHAGEDGAVVRIPDPGSDVSPMLVYRRYKTSDPYTTALMRPEDNQVVGVLPPQPPAGKVEYSILLSTREGEVRIPPAGSVVLRYRGDVPVWVMIPHIVLVFVAMLLAMRTGLEALVPRGNVRALAWWTLALLVVGGLIFGPLMQLYAFGALWTGVPFGWDLTDNKTLVAVLGWMAACLVVGWRRGSVRPAGRWSSLAAALLTVVIFSIPHSMLGSELDYEKVDEGVAPAEAIGQG